MQFFKQRKNNLLYFPIKVKTLHFICVLNMALQIFVLAKFNKLRVKRDFFALLI